MFYPVESLKRGGRFYLCWVADSWPLRFATISHRQLWSQDIRQICDDLLEVMQNESGRIKNRFSLRLSSQLMRGLVRLYQRKVTVFIGDLCMINAIVIKGSNKKPIRQATSRVTVMPRLVIEELPDDDKIVERIQNSRNTVAHVQDITMIEPILPQNMMFLEDGFGELHPEQARAARQLSGDQWTDQSGNQSGLRSANQSHDLSRPLHEPDRMLAISEHEISVFRKSIGEGLLPGVDIEKEIPEIPEISEILVPNPPPHGDNQTEQVIIAEETVPSPKAIEENAKEKSQEEFILQELEEPQVKRRKLIKNKLIIDKKIKLSPNYFRSRIENIKVELRCEDSTYDIVSVYPSASLLLGRAAHCGPAMRSAVSYQLTRLFASSLGVGHRQPADHIEEILAPRVRRSHMRSILEKIDEEIEPADKRLESIHHKIQDISKEINITIPQIELDVLQAQIPQDQEIMDISDLPTQKLLTVSQRLTTDDGPPPKRQRHCGYVSYRQSQQAALELSNIEINKENIPDYENRHQDANRLTAMLVEAGLADIQEQKRSTQVETVHQVSATQRSRRNGSESSETQLGSLDRTKVSLGDSDKTTDSKRFILEEWGTQRTMHKIYWGVRRGERPLDMRRLTAPTRSRLAVARCFASVLKLKQHGFITVVKDPDTNEILDIELGSKIVASRRHDY